MDVIQNTPATTGFGRCPQHPTAPISRRCDNCSTMMCETCEFHFPINTYVCPVCVVAPVVVSEKRRLVAKIGLGCTVLSVLSLVIACTGSVSGGTAFLLGLAMVFPAAMGLTLSVSAMDVNRGNDRLIVTASTMSVTWIALIFVFCVIGITRLAHQMKEHAEEPRHPGLHPYTPQDTPPGPPQRPSSY